MLSIPGHWKDLALWTAFITGNKLSPWGEWRMGDHCCVQTLWNRGDFSWFHNICVELVSFNYPNCLVNMMEPKSLHWKHLRVTVSQFGEEKNPLSWHFNNSRCLLPRDNALVHWQNYLKHFNLKQKSFFLSQIFLYNCFPPSFELSW